MDRKQVTTAAVALALALAGCGSSTSTRPMTRAEFTTAAHKICTHRAAQFRAALASHRGDYRAALLAAVQPLEDSVKQLEALRPPAALRAAFDDVMAWERHQVAISHELVRTGRIPAGATEDGPPLHHHEAERVTMRMQACG
jgi:hypothetical protein